MGYSIRLESKRSFRTKILVCTTGQFCQLGGRIWSSRHWNLLKGSNHPKTSKNPVTGWQMCSELIRNCPRLEITGVKISETRYDSNINKLGIWISFMCICRLHEFFWIWQSDILQLKRCASPTVGKWSSTTQCDAYHCRRMLCPQAIFWCERCKWN